MNYTTIETYGPYTLYLDARKNIVAYARLFDPPDMQPSQNKGGEDKIKRLHGVTREQKKIIVELEEENEELQIMNTYLRQEIKKCRQK